VQPLGGDVDEELDRRAAATGFAGVVRVDTPTGLQLERSYGLANRAHGIANTTATRFAIASGTKSLTALTVVRLVEDGLLDLATPARALLGADLPLVGDAVTVEHLLCHRSGIGDYVDEETDLDVADYILTVGVHELSSTERYLAVLDGHPTKFPPGERFAYCNSGYVILALLAERAASEPFDALVRRLVCEPAGMVDTAFLRSDELPGGVATGYVEVAGRWRSNVFHLPVLGSGDGGIYTTAADVAAFWRSFLAGALVSPTWVAEVLRDRSPDTGEQGYGLGFWLGADGGTVAMEGSDAGVSFRSWHAPRTGVTATVVANTTDGAWPLAELLAERLA
jgi:CubicO group peptidase (beta-lactamase class C family)